MVPSGGHQYWTGYCWYGYPNIDCCYSDIAVQMCWGMMALFNLLLDCFGYLYYSSVLYWTIYPYIVNINIDIKQYLTYIHKYPKIPCYIFFQQVKKKHAPCPSYSCHLGEWLRSALKDIGICRQIFSLISAFSLYLADLNHSNPFRLCL